MRIVVSVLVVAALVAAYVAVLVYYSGEGAQRSVAIKQGDLDRPDRVDIAAALLSVDQIKQEAVIRLEFAPRGNLINPDGVTLAKDVTLLVSSASGSQERNFAKGKIMSPTDVTADMFNGNVTDYPFDKFESILAVVLTDTPKAGVEAQPVPVALLFTGRIHGLNISEGTESASTTGNARVHINVSRSATTVANAGFVMALLLIVSLAVLRVTIKVVVGGRKLEPQFLGLLGALLFGFVAFRNAMPGTPPIGALADYLSFFWAEGLVAVCLFVLVIIYPRRLPSR